MNNKISWQYICGKKDMTRIDSYLSLYKNV